MKTEKRSLCSYWTHLKEKAHQGIITIKDNILVFAKLYSSMAFQFFLVVKLNACFLKQLYNQSQKEFNNQTDNFISI